MQGKWKMQTRFVSVKFETRHETCMSWVHTCITWVWTNKFLSSLRRYPELVHLCSTGDMYMYNVCIPVNINAFSTCTVMSWISNEAKNTFDTWLNLIDMRLKSDWNEVKMRNAFTSCSHAKNAHFKHMLYLASGLYCICIIVSHLSCSITNTCAPVEYTYIYIYIYRQDTCWRLEPLAMHGKSTFLSMTGMCMYICTCIHTIFTNILREYIIPDYVFALW